MIRAISRVALTVVVVAAATGCTVGFGPVSPPDPAGPGEPPITETQVDERCDGLLSATDVDGLWAGDLVPEQQFPFGAAATWTMEGTALVQSEALICTWLREDDTPAALLVVMGDGEDGFRRSEALFRDAGGPYVAVPIFDAAYVACRKDEVVSCHWNVLNGADWISLFLIDVPEEQMLAGDLTATASAHVVSAVGDAVRALEIPPTPSTTPPSECTVRLTPDTLAGPLGVEAARVTVLPSPRLEEETLEGTSPRAGQVMWKYAYELLGYSNCGIHVDGRLVGVAFVATGSGWVLRDSAAVQPELVEVGGHGDGIEECTPQGSLTSCTVAFASGDDLYFAQFGVPSELDGAAIALATLELLLD